MRIRVAGVVLVSALAACGPPAGPGQQSLPPTVYGGPITSTIRYENANVVLDVPTTAATGVSWLQAYDNCRTGEAVCDLSRSPTIVLASATTLTSGEAQADGSIRPAVENQLVYVIAWMGVSCPAPAGPARTYDSGQSCQIVNLVDARTGRVLYTFQGPSTMDSSTT